MARVFTVLTITADTFLELGSIRSDFAYGYDEWHQVAMVGTLGGGTVRFEVKCGDLGYVPVNGLDNIVQANFNSTTNTWCERASAAGDEWAFRLVGSTSPSLRLAFT